MAENLRIVFDNASDRSTLTATSEAGNLVVTNLLTDYKSEVWRTTTTTVTLTLTWPTTEFIGMLALSFCNLSSQGTFSVRGYTYANDTVPLFSTGPQQAAAGATLDGVGWGMSPLGANAYTYSDKSYGVIWFDIQPIQRLEVDISDPTNIAGYLEAARIITGPWWSPLNNTEYGASLSLVDSSVQERTDAGDLRTDRGMTHKTLSFTLNYMPAEDRNFFWNMMKRNGLSYPLFISISPECDDPFEEELFQVYGKLSKLSPIKYQFMNMFNSQVDIEEV